MVLVTWSHQCAPKHQENINGNYRLVRGEMHTPLIARPSHRGGNVVEGVGGVEGAVFRVANHRRGEVVEAAHVRHLQRKNKTKKTKNSRGEASGRGTPPARQAEDCYCCGGPTSEAAAAFRNSDGATTMTTPRLKDASEPKKEEKKKKEGAAQETWIKAEIDKVRWALLT